MNTIFFLVVTLSSIDPMPSVRVEGIHDFHSLTLADAQQLEGRIARYRVVLDSSSWVVGKYTLYDCTSRNNVLRAVWLLEDTDKDELVVEGVLRIIVHEASIGAMGMFFPAFTEYRLTEVK